MHHVITLDEHGNTVTDEEFDEVDAAARRYIRIVLNQPDVHVRWHIGETLPGMPPVVAAHRFGNPCEAPCCAPLAEPWPEQNPVSQDVTPVLSEREERS